MWTSDDFFMAIEDPCWALEERSAKDLSPLAKTHLEPSDPTLRVTGNRLRSVRPRNR